MLLRAIFFIAAVALLAPPGSGYGAPSAADVASACKGGTCTLDPTMLGAMKEKVLASLSRVKADIAQAQRERRG
jgi:hypothetical protein